MKRSLPLCCVLFLIATAALAADPSLPDLFKRAKAEFAGGDYKRSLADFELLDTTSAQPANASDRAKLIPVITFYRGANLAALGRKAEAKDAFIAYLGYTPAAAIASPPYPKATVELFEQARKEAATHSTTMAASYAAFVVPAGWTFPSDEHWIDSPVHYLFSAEGRKRYLALITNAQRAGFVAAFWKQFDPTPGTDVNEFRAEFERRVAFADANFPSDKLPGRDSDRAAIFVFLGPPTYAAKSNITTSGDAMAALRARGNDDMSRAAHSSASTSTASMSAMSNQPPEDRHDQDYNRGTSETWVYRGDRVPKGNPFQEVRFAFLTREGYGSGVLQKDTEPMKTLSLAVDNALHEKKLN
jgi:GWxTD domain-containing protein